jgi:ribonuclease Z
LEITTLGIGSASPHKERHPSATLVKVANDLLLIDCGEGTQYRLLENRIKTKRLKYIFISHLHGDHYFGLVGLLSSLNMNKRTEELIIYGPVGLKKLLNLQFSLSDTKLNFKISIKVTNPDTAEELLNNDSLLIHTFPLKHRISCTGFLIAQKAAKRKVLTDLLPSDFPAAYFKMLSDGQSVNDTHTGKFYKNTDFTSDGEESKTFAYCSDTIFDTEIVKHIKNVDLLYHEATFLETEKNRAKITFHATASEAAQIAKLAQVKQLLLGHFSARYDSLDLFLEEAAAVFPNTLLAEQGKSVII